MADKKYTLVDTEGLELMCKAIRESHSVADAIDDENVATNSTFSSKHITDLIDAIPIFDGDAETVNGHTVEVDVPTDAKFTDTIYDDSNVVNRLDTVDTALANIYSDDASDITETHAIKNITVGYDISDQDISYNIEHTRIGKVHYVRILGGGKIQSDTAYTYKFTVTITVPGYFTYKELLQNKPAQNITISEEPTIVSDGSNVIITITYTQPNSTSAYSPNNLYYIDTLVMLYED